jgi:FAD/FMN-containing dehydrogenase
MSSDLVLERAARILGPDGLQVGELVRERPTNWQGQGSCRAKAVVRPSSTAQVASILELCHETGQTLVAALRASCAARRRQRPIWS